MGEFLRDKWLNEILNKWIFKTWNDDVSLWFFNKLIMKQKIDGRGPKFPVVNGYYVSRSETKIYTRITYVQGLKVEVENFSAYKFVVNSDILKLLNKKLVKALLEPNKCQRRNWSNMSRV